MIRTIIWFIYFWVYMVCTIPMLIRIKYLEKHNRIEEKDRLVDECVKNWAVSLVRLSGSKIRVYGEENIPEGPVVFVGNHQGNFDVPIFLGYIKKPKAFIAKIEIKKMPIVSTWMKYMKCVFINRDDIRQSLKAIKTGVDYINQGHSMIIFPEGTRSRADTLGEFKPGSFKLALKSKVPIVPVTTKGSYKIMEKNGFLIKPAEVEIIISKPIPTSGLSREEAEEIPSRVRNIIQSNLQS